ncbi:MAG: excinuclease [bacterium]|nr:excinuclease [bacterium]
MKCEVCNKSEASIKITQINNNQKKEMNLCYKCAQSKGMNNPLAHLSSLMGSMLSGIIDKVVDEQTRTENIVCKNCSMSLKRFFDSGLLGCGSCYNAFESELKRILHRYHGSTSHKLRKDDRSAENIETRFKRIDRLKSELDTAVKSENFEYAAELRDSIKMLLNSKSDDE